MRLWSIARIQSRLVLKLLIGLNIIFFFYQLYTYNRLNNQIQCIILKNSTSNYEFYPERSSSISKLNHSKLVWWKFEIKNKYHVLSNYIISDNQKFDSNGNILKADDYNTSITYTTQGSYEFLKHSEQLCKRFDGPVSVSVYSPGKEFMICLKLIYYLRNCGHPCVKSNVSWHMVYDKSLPIENLSLFTSPDDFLNNDKNDFKINCSINYDAYLNEITSIFGKEKSQNIRTQNSLPYPINVLRNVARYSVNTKYVLASDIELYPSINIVKMFKVLLDKEMKGNISLIDRNKRHVYVLPIFEVYENVEVPETKPELIELMNKGSAIFFHKWVCDTCQKFVDREKWLIETLDKNQLNIFRKTKRKTSYWEPLYIGTNDDPLYDELLTWDGKRDKMSQMFEMCLLDYDLLILDNAFLCHAPGVKHIDPKDQKRRLNFIKENNIIYKKIIEKLRSIYPKNTNC